jgi:hypothetical protein
MLLMGYTVVLVNTSIQPLFFVTQSNVFLYILISTADSTQLFSSNILADLFVIPVTLLSISFSI